MPFPRFLDDIPIHADLSSAAFSLPVGRDVPDWFAGHREPLLNKVVADGWAIVRDVPIRNAANFAAAIARLEIPLAVHYGDLPLHLEIESVFRTTAYPKTEEILFHNEAAHQRSSPRFLFFCCLAPAASGGETPISDGIAALRSLPDQLRRRLSDEGLLYKRSFLTGLDVDWRTAFGTNDRDAVVAKCLTDGIEIEWMEEDGLAITALVPAIAPTLGGEFALCHQVDLFHPFFLPPEVRMLMWQRGGPTGLPRSIAFGDGTPLSDAEALQLHEASREYAIVFPWRQGDILILDNFRMAHGRRSYTGDRSHFVMMSALARRDFPPQSS